MQIPANVSSVNYQEEDKMSDFPTCEAETKGNRNECARASSLHLQRFIQSQLIFVLFLILYLCAVEIKSPAQYKPCI